MPHSGYHLDGLPVKGTNNVSTVESFLKLFRFNDVEEGATFGYTPLRYAALHSNGKCFEIVKRLVAAGADLEVS